MVEGLGLGLGRFNFESRIWRSLVLALDSSFGDRGVAVVGQDLEDLGIIGFCVWMVFSHGCNLHFPTRLLNTNPKP